MKYQIFSANAIFSYVAGASIFGAILLIVQFQWNTFWTLLIVHSIIVSVMVYLHYRDV